MLTKQQTKKSGAEKQEAVALHEVDAARVAELREAFMCFDQDNSGSIDHPELASLMSNLGIKLSEDVS